VLLSNTKSQQRVTKRALSDSACAPAFSFLDFSAAIDLLTGDDQIEVLCGVN
jgi:hypothetical protein